jgi:hypothetical protein
LNAFILCRFYGWSLDYTKTLTVEDFQLALMAVTRIEAREMLTQMTIADYPNISKEDRSSTHKKIHRHAFPPTETRTMSLEDFSKHISAVVMNG